mgnify:CR=1 FL=1|tara:strand:+ start:867 stop:1349 length:483 start_codon:yes stop_codon:yes gene_type:complete
MKIKTIPNPELLEQIKSIIPDAVEVIIPFWGDDTSFDIGSDYDSIEAFDEQDDDIDLDDEEINYNITEKSRGYIHTLLSESKFFFNMKLFMSGYVSFDLKKKIATTCLSDDMNDINYMKRELKSQGRSDEEVDKILKSFPKDYFTEGGEDMIESFSMSDK